jgi:uncharacterized membrane protein
MTTPSSRIHFSPEDFERLAALRHRRPARSHVRHAPSRGDRLADWFAETVGSWRFIIIQSAILALWIAMNVTAYVRHWDPYPFILLNLALSFQAAYAAPIIMMSQNRQSDVDRHRAEHDYQVNIKAELEIELLHQKIDALREQEMIKLIGIIERLSDHLAPGLRSVEDSRGIPGA